MQVQQTMHDIEANLARKCVSEPARLPASKLDADENFAMRKRQHVSGTTSAKELSM